MFAVVPAKPSYLTLISGLCACHMITLWHHPPLRIPPVLNKPGVLPHQSNINLIKVSKTLLRFHKSCQGSTNLVKVPQTLLRFQKPCWGYKNMLICFEVLCACMQFSCWIIGRNNIECHVAVNQKRFMIKTLYPSNKQVVHASELYLVYSGNNCRSASKPHHTQLGQKVDVK